MGPASGNVETELAREKGEIQPRLEGGMLSASFTLELESFCSPHSPCCYLFHAHHPHTASVPSSRARALLSCEQASFPGASSPPLGTTLQPGGGFSLCLEHGQQPLPQLIFKLVMAYGDKGQRMKKEQTLFKLAG